MQRARPGKRAWAILGGLAILAVAALGTLLATDGVNAFKDYSHETCDGKRPPRTLDDAARIMVTSALNDDAAGVCRAMGAWTGQGQRWVSAQMVTDLRSILTKHGITQENLRVEVPPEEQLGNHYVVYLSAGTEATRVITSGQAVWNAGFVMNFPAGVSVPEVAEPSGQSGEPSVSASVDAPASASTSAPEPSTTPSP